MDMLPLFPLSTVLLPTGRLPLQVFERRYLDLVTSSLRHQQAFGIVWITEGREVQRPGRESPQLAGVGVEASIVDWDSLPNGLLGITVEGGRRFNLQESWQQDNGLWMAEVEYWPQEPHMPLPDESSEWLALLQQLAEHPHVQRLGMSLEVDDAASLGCRLAQLLPIAENARYQLLIASDPVSRLDLLHDILEEFGE